MLTLTFFIPLMAILMAAGMTVLIQLNVDQEHTSTGRLALAFGLGLALLSCVLTLVGLFRVLTSLSAWAVVLLFALLSVPGWRQMMAVITSSLRKLRKSIIEDHWSGIILLAIGILLGASLIAALAPPTEGDALRLYLVVPKVFVQEQGVIFQPFWPFAMPHSLHLVMAWAMILESVNLGVLLYWGCGLALVLASYAMARRCLPVRFSLLSALIVCSTPLFLQALVGAEPDICGALFITLAFVLFQQWETKGRPRNRLLALCGGFMGVAVSTKTTMLPAAVALGIVILVYVFRYKSKTSLRDLMQLLTAIGIPFAVLGSVWYIRNWIVAGNPVWPFYYDLFPDTRHLSEAALYGQKAYRAALFFPLGRDLVAFLTGPFRVLLSDLPLARGAFGLTLAAFVPPTVLYLKSSRTLKQSALLFISYYVLWFFTNQQTSFYIIILPVLSFLAVHTVYYALSELHLPGQALLYLVLVFSLAVGAGGSIFYAAQFTPVVLGLQSREQFLLQKAPYSEILLWINENLPEDAIVMTDVEPVFYLDRRFLIATFWSGIFDYGNITTVEELCAEMKRQGVTHVLSTSTFEQKEIENPLQGPIVNHYNRLRHELLENNLELIYSYEQEKSYSRTLGLAGGIKIEQAYIYRFRE